MFWLQHMHLKMHSWAPDSSLGWKMCAELQNRMKQYVEDGILGCTSWLYPVDFTSLSVSLVVINWCISFLLVLWQITTCLAQFIILLSEGQKYNRGLIGLKFRCWLLVFPDGDWGKISMSSPIFQRPPTLLGLWSSLHLSSLSLNLLSPASLFPSTFFLFFGETGSHYVAQAGLKLMILPLQPPECWDYRHVLPHSDFPVLLFRSLWLHWVCLGNSGHFPLYCVKDRSLCP
jgi:hypothetical protein